MFVDHSTNRIGFLSSVREREKHKEKKHNKDKYEGERWGKECEAEVGLKMDKKYEQK